MSEEVKESSMMGYFKGCWHEMTKVTWLTKNQAVRLTIIVMTFCILIALFLGILDYLFSELHSYSLSITNK